MKMDNKIISITNPDEVYSLVRLINDINQKMKVLSETTNSYIVCNRSFIKFDKNDLSGLVKIDLHNHIERKGRSKFFINNNIMDFFEKSTFTINGIELFQYLSNKKSEEIAEVFVTDNTGLGFTDLSGEIFECGINKELLSKLNTINNKYHELTKVPNLFSVESEIPFNKVLEKELIITESEILGELPPSDIGYLRVIISRKHLISEIEKKSKYKVTVRHIELMNDSYIVEFTITGSFLTIQQFIRVLD